MNAEVESEVAAPEEGAAAFQRILLKLSGEALLGSQEYGIDRVRVEALHDRQVREQLGGTVVLEAHLHGDRGSRRDRA